jgi:Big-like domain-containing protein
MSGHGQRRGTLALAFALAFTSPCLAGGPKYVAGASYFDPLVMGQPIIWAQGQVNYYTDLGDLSPILPGPSADTFVANAFSQWTSVSTAAITATRAGQLAEDVSGSNVILNADGTISMPSDIQPSATTTPVGIVYDADGSGTSALLGSGAGDPIQCFANAAFGGIDNFAAQGNFLHALVVINGQCAQKCSQLPDVEYRLVRILGGVLGLGWAQVNLNVITGNPPATAADLSGFSVMHFMDPINCVPITLCYPNPNHPAMDDIAALSRLYPVTTQNQSSFPGKRVFSATTARIHGSVWFTDASGKSSRAMQGVNVVARWIDPSSGKPSRSYVAAAVSGFLFSGNAGNPITGFNDPLGNPYNQFGSSDSTVEGFFDLAGLQIPAGTTGQYQLTVEALDPLWSDGVGPYEPWQVGPSGTAQPILVNVGLGLDVDQDVLMSGSARPVPHWATSESFALPAQVPLAGDWVGSLDSYGEVAYFWLPAQANRTMSVEVTALDENGVNSESKVQPVVGVWALSDAQGTPPPAFTTSPFNTAAWGLTRLDAQLLSSTSFRIGISDVRGDGRPDYHYHAHVLYGDSAIPARMSVSGGPVILKGIGFAPGLNVTFGSTSASPLAVGANQMTLSAPPQSDGPQTINITDPVTGAFSTMTGALTYGASASDSIVLLQGTNPLTPVGVQATNPVSVRVVASDGKTPVSGATVGWITSNGATLSACAGASFCSVATDASGVASSGVTPGATGAATIIATLAPGVYSSSPSVATTLIGTESSSDIGAISPYLWIAQGATVSTPLTARVLSNGVPQIGVTVNFSFSQGPGTLSAASAKTDNNGYASVTLSVTNFAGSVQLSACVGQNNSPCQSIYGNAVAASAIVLQPVSGTSQIIALGKPFQPLTVRVTDSSVPPNPVLGRSVLFQSTVTRPISNSTGGASGEPNTGGSGDPNILTVSQSSVLSDANGLANIVPSVGAFTGPLEVVVMITTGTNAMLQYGLEALPAMSGPVGGPVRPPLRNGPANRMRRPNRASAEPIPNQRLFQRCSTWLFDRTADAEILSFEKK